MSLKDKKILIGISGGIAAYKICELTRLFKKAGAEVKIIMTPSAARFVSPITLSTLSGNEVLMNMFPDIDSEKTESVTTKTWHIDLGMWADIFIIAPATANTIAKITYGISDNFLLAIILAARCPVIIAPSMDEDMLKIEITRSNISKLKERGYFIIEPEEGELASGLHGKGRLPEPLKIIDYISNFLTNNKKDLKGKKVLVTAGPTYEPIDDVRFIGNYSSGKMGFQLAKAASMRGADVTLISGPSSLETPRNIERVDIQTADEMYSSIKDKFENFDYIIMSAAVSDFKPKKFYKGKIKKENKNDFIIEIEKTVDILEFLGKNKKKFKLVGFALETKNDIENGIRKIKNKNLDFIVINNSGIKGAAFGVDTNVVTIIDNNMNKTPLPLMSKFELSNVIFDKLIN